MKTGREATVVNAKLDRQPGGAHVPTCALDVSQRRVGTSRQFHWTGKMIFLLRS